MPRSLLTLWWPSLTSSRHRLRTDRESSAPEFPVGDFSNRPIRIITHPRQRLGSSTTATTPLPTHLRQGLSLRAVEAWMKLAARSEMAAMDTIRCALAIVGALVISMQVGWRCCNEGTCCGVADVVAWLRE